MIPGVLCVFCLRLIAYAERKTQAHATKFYRSTEDVWFGSLLFRHLQVDPAYSFAANPEDDM